MANWTTPITNWAITDYINYDDLNTIEEDTEYIYDEMIAHINPDIPTPQVSQTTPYEIAGRSGFKTDRTTDWIDFYQDYFAMDNNIEFLKNYVVNWPVWATFTTPRNDLIPLAVLDYTDFNRMGNNNAIVYQVVEGIKTEMKICGTAYSGEEISL